MDVTTLEGRGKTAIQRRDWWRMTAHEAADSISHSIRFLIGNQSNRIQQYVTSTRLYGGLHLVGLQGFSYANLSNTKAAGKDRLTRNIAQSVTDTITSKIGKNKPRPFFLTSGGDWQLQYKAKRLNRLIDGVFFENHAYDMGMITFRDACVLGDGIIHVFAKHGRVGWERVLASELWVDEVEAFYGEPRVMHRMRPVDRGVLADLFPSKRSVIMDAQGTVIPETGVYPTIADMVTVRESWHLPSGPEAKDGKHILTIEGEALTPLEDWPHDFFPFARFSWAPRMYGYWAQSLVEQIQPLQVELNKLLYVAQRSYQLGGTFKVFLENGSKVVKEHLNADVGAIVTYTGTPPQYVTPPVLPPEMYQHMESLERKAFEQAGVSLLSAASQKPAGLNAAVAMREYNDIESDRFMTVGRAYERFYLDLAELSLAVIREIVESGEAFEIAAPGPRSLERIDYEEIEIKDGEEFRIQCFPVSSLPNEPAGRLQTIQEYAQAGYLSPEQAKKLLPFPDLEAEDSLTGAAEEWLTHLLDDIVERGKFAPLEPLDDLASARRLALQYYQRGKVQGLEEERLEMIRRLLTQIDELEQDAQAEAAAAQAAMQPPPAQPVAPPVPPQQSQLVPNAAPQGVA